MLSSHLEGPQRGEVRRAPNHHLQTVASVNPALEGFPLDAKVRKALNAKRGWEEEEII